MPLTRLAKRNDGQVLVLDLTNGTITIPNVGMTHTFGGEDATLSHVRSAGGWVEGEPKPKDWPKGVEGWPEAKAAAAPKPPEAPKVPAK